VKARLGWKTGLVAGVLVGLVVGGTLAWAAIPDGGTGKVTACYATSGPSKGILRVIDYQAGERCAGGEASIGLQPFVACSAYPRAGVDWRGCDFTHVNLGLENLTGAKLSSAVFTAASLGLALLTDANLASANLSFANLGGANLTRANLTGANLSGATLTSAALNGTQVAGATFTNTELGGTNYSQPSNRPVGTRIDGVVGLTSSQLLNVKISNVCCTANFDASCTTPHRNFQDVTIKNTNLAGFDLRGAYFEHADLSSLNLSNTNLSCSYAAFANFKSVNFTGANMRYAKFGGALLTGAIFNNTTCPDGTNSNTNGNTCAGHL
jgi:uncharacterized protein YjbI with pentapeptide repeats